MQELAMQCHYCLVTFCKYFVNFNGLQLFAHGLEKTELRSVMTILTDSFILLHALLFCLRIEMVIHVSSWGPPIYKESYEFHKFFISFS